MDDQREEVTEAVDKSDVIDEPLVAEVGIEADATVGYASIQNSVPIMRSLCVTNRSLDALENLQVLVACDPAFAQGVNLRFDRLMPSESRCIKPVDLSPEHAFLADLTEAVNAEVRVSVLAGGVEIAHAAKSVAVLAYDQWAGTRALPELLAAFCMPNNPAVDILVGKASKLLREHDSRLSMNGYQEKSRDVVWKQTSALYSAICAEGLQYAEPPASFGTDGQKIRTPERILDGRVATCLDLAMLFASCLEQAGLYPVVLIKEGHAWVGVWLHKTCFPDAITDDVQAIRKRVDAGELLVFEATSVTQHRDLRPTLKRAREHGYQYLMDATSFRYAVDIHRARETQIKPLPSKVKHPCRPIDGSSESESPPAIELIPDLPPLDPAVLSPLDLPTEDTPAGRLAKWKSKLLDLTLRNRLLNFKPTKSTLPLIVPRIAALEDALAGGAEFRIRPRPEIAEGNGLPMPEVHASRHGHSLIEDMAVEALKDKVLYSKTSQGVMDGNLLAIFSAARTNLEDGGANTLYLALGFLQWTETDKPTVTHSAPIILVPVQLHRQSVRSGFRLSRHEDDTIINPTLLQLLENNFKLQFPELKNIPTDDSGVDVEKILQVFRLAVGEIQKWEVTEEIQLGIFSFKKYLMWKDLQDRTDQLKGNRVVEYLIEHPDKAFQQQNSDKRFEHLDSAYGPQDMLTPLLTDSSQLKAICTVDSGRDMVLEGPPGTGKSQTIANLIAHSLAKGKTVLFVSEKMAALEVVYRRLAAIGLGPFCLELHSSKAKKTDVIQQLGMALEASAGRVDDDWRREAGRLAALRQDLNGLVECIHRRYPNGLTVFDAIGTCIAHAGQTSSPMPLTDALTHKRADLDRMREISRKMAALASEVGSLTGNPLSQIGQHEWSPTWQDKLLDAAQALDDAAGLLNEKVAAVSKLTGLQFAGLSFDAYAHVDSLADILLSAPRVPVGLAGRAHESAARSSVHLLAKHGVERDKCWKLVGDGWEPQLATLDTAGLQKKWDDATSSWWLKSALGKRDFRKHIACYREDHIPPPDAVIEKMLDGLTRVNEEDESLRSLESEAKKLLGEEYAGLETNWENLTGYEDWANKFADAVTLVENDGFIDANHLRQNLRSLVVDKRVLLSPDGFGRRGLSEYRDAWRNLQRRKEEIEALAKPLSPLEGAIGSGGAIERIRGIISKWQTAKDGLKSWCLWRNARNQAIEEKLKGIVETLEAGAVSLQDIVAHFEFSYRHWWVKKVIDKEPILLHFSSADHERKIFEFRQVDEEFQKLTERYITAILAAKIPAHGSEAMRTDSELGRLSHELQKQRRHMPVRQLMQTLPTLLPRLKPCLLMSPLSVAQYLDASHAHFDLVVFDEASQISVWDAVGAIARGKQLVVVGDPKQLPPTNFFNKGVDDDEDTLDDVNVEDLESILDECLAIGMNKERLKWHYRSKHESLITFSNITYYDSELITFPSASTDDNAVTFKRVQGIYDRGGTRTNRAEAEAVVDGIEKHYTSGRSGKKTLGVVTFNKPQQALIETLLDARRGKNTALDAAIAVDTKEPLFIKNLENVQGDERDIIFFSITYGPDAAGRMTMNFGPLSHDGGQRRLNVAVSRAREAVVVYSALLPEQIDIAKVRPEGVRDLKHYLEFAIRGSKSLVEQSRPTGLAPDSPFETAVIKVLQNRGWEVHPQVGCSGFRIDLGVVDPGAPGKYLAGIECDGRAYHSSATARDRDRLRQYILEQLGWNILRIWSTDWWLNPEREIKKVEMSLDALRISSDTKRKEEAEVEERAHAEAEAEAKAQAETKAQAEVEAKAQGEVRRAETTTELELESVVRPIVENTPGDRQLPLMQAMSNGIGSIVQQRSAVSDVEVHQFIYEITKLELRDSAAFYDPKVNQELINQLRQVIETEGPVLEQVLFRRVARAWSLLRTGSRIARRLERLAPKTVKCTKESVGTFYWPSNSEASEWSGFRLAGANNSSQRNVNEVCTEELGNLVCHALDAYGAAGKEDIAKAVSRLLGISRTSADAETRIGSAIDRLIIINKITESDGLYQIVL